MKAVLKKQLDEMTEDELQYLLRRDYLRRLTRYRMTDNFYRKKYNMDFEDFEKANIVQRENYSFEVESDAQEWELAVDGIKTVEKKSRNYLMEIGNIIKEVSDVAGKYDLWLMERDRTDNIVNLNLAKSSEGKGKKSNN